MSVESYSLAATKAQKNIILYSGCIMILLEAYFEANILAKPCG